MILVDTSAWIAMLRGNESPVDHHLTQLVDDDADLFMTEPIVMELLAGARDVAHRRELGRFVRRFDLLPVSGLDDYEAAALHWSTCRQRGVTVRSLLDCVVAQVAIRNAVPVLHDDRDFDRLAEHTSLQLSPL